MNDALGSTPKTDEAKWEWGRSVEMVGQWRGRVWVCREGGLAASSLSEDERFAQTTLFINTAALAIFLTAT